MLWKIAKIFLDPKTRAKCVVLKSSELHKLSEYFNPEDLPEEYGGTCRCENGCLPPVPKHMVRNPIPLNLNNQVRKNNVCMLPTHCTSSSKFKRNEMSPETNDSQRVLNLE